MSYQFAYRKIAQALYLSLQHEPFYTQMERSVSQDPDAGREAMTRYFDYSMKEGRQYGELYLPDGAFYGASIWCRPTNDALSSKIMGEKKTFLRQNLGETCLKKYKDMVDFMSGKAENIIPAASWYLSIVGLSPQYQNRGLGGTLVKPILDITDSFGMPSYLETFNARNKHFYQRLGYKEIASFIEPVTNAEYWVMLREPLHFIKE